MPESFTFPPAASGSGDSWDPVAYAKGKQSGGFIFPPAQKVDQDQGYEVARQVAEEINSIRDTAVDAGEQVYNLGVVVEDYGNILERKVEPWAVPTVAPLSSTINRRADPTFQLSDFMAPVMRGTDSRGDTVSTVADRLQEGANTKGRVYFTFLTPAINRAYEKLNFMVSEVTSPCQMDVALYVVNEDRILNLQVHKTNVTLALGRTVATVTFDRWVATQGSYICIAWLQHGTGNSRFLLGLDDAPRPLTEDVYPRKISAIYPPTGRTSLPATINGTTETDFSFWFTPYAELSENLGLVLRTFVDNWPDVGAAIRPWVPLTSPGIRSAGGYTAAGGLGMRVSMYDTPLSTDKVQVRSSIHSLWDNNMRRSTLIIRGSNDLRTGLGFSAISPGEGGKKYQLISWTNRDVGSDWGNRTVIATVNQTPRVGDQIEVNYVDGLVTVLLNGVEVVSSVAALGLQGERYRFVGIQNERQGNIFSAWPSPWFGPWIARDLTQSSGGDEDEDEGA